MTSWLIEALQADSSAAPDARPFGELLQPLVCRAALQLEEYVSHRSWLGAAIPGLKIQLLRQLCAIAALPLYLWLNLHEPSPDPMAYRRWVAAMRSSNGPACWPRLFDEYPELARLLTLLTQNWSRAGLEFLQRLDQDRPALEDFLKQPDLRVHSVALGLSDSHHGGRSVMRIDFSGGSRVAYKPRPLAAEATFSRLLAGVAATHPDLALPAAAVLPRPGYGWMFWLAPSASLDSAAWYCRAGMLQCLLQTLGATDAHMANCVATATGPALIDCECLLTPRLAAEERATGSGNDPGHHLSDPARFFAEIHEPGFLSIPRRPAAEPDLSGLFGSGGQATGYRVPVWRHDSSGALTLSFQAAVLRSQANLLPQGSPSISRMAAGKTFLRGYTEMHTYLGCHSREVEAVLAPLAAEPARALLRQTRRYTHILSQSIHPRLLRDRGARRRLVRSLLAEEPLAGSSFATDDILDREVSSLECLDVPLFQAHGCDLTFQDEVVTSGFFALSGHDVAIGKLRDLSDKTLSPTLEALRLSWLMTL